jgi:predicted nucleotidyltransferase
VEQAELLRRVKAVLREAYGDRLRGVILYGSEVRGTAEPDSDIDLLVLLAGPIDSMRDSLTSIHALYPLVLEFERPIHTVEVNADEYQTGDWPLYREVRREGVPA